MKPSRRAISLLLAMLMVFALLPTTVVSAEPSETRVNLVVVDGQSNAAGTAGTLDGATVEMPGVGEAFLWEGVGATTLQDLNTYVTTKINNGTTSSIGFHPALAKKLNEKTGLKTVILHAGFSGQSISRWTAANKAQVVNAINNCKQAIENKGYQIANTGYIWHQGESDACAVYAADYCYYRTLDEYYDMFLPVHQAYIDALGGNAIGGFITVQTRQQLNAGVNKPSEYCGMRAAQQALANQNSNLIIASEITDGWRASTDREKFSSKGGMIHYSQTGYNLIGADAGENLADAWLNPATAVTDFKLMGNSANEYAEGDTVIADDIMRDIHTENTSERGAAQLVVKPYPLNADCSTVTMTLKDANENDYSSLITANGYIASAAALPESLTLTVKADNITKTYTLEGLPQSADYYWDFTDNSKREGNVLHAVTDDNWTANDATYQATLPDLNATTGLSQDNANKKYFELAYPVTLSVNKPWTIEWKGTMAAASIVASYYQNGTRKEHIWYDGNGVMHVRNSGGSADMYSFNMAAAAGKAATWYMIHDGRGGLTMVASYGNTLLMQKTENAVKADYHISAILGRYDSLNFNYHNSIQYMKVYDGAADLPVSVTSVDLTRPDMGYAPQTTITGEHFTGTATWTPDDEVYQDGVAYTADVTLLPEEGFFFSGSQDLSIPAAAISDLVITSESITFKAAFSEIIGKYNYYWDFTDLSAVSGNVLSAKTDSSDWVANDLTYSKSSISLNASGVGRGQGYFTMDKPVMLPQNEPWYVEFNGTTASGSFVISNPDPNSGSSVTGAGADYVFMTKNQGDQYRLYLVPGGNAGANNVANLPLGESTTHTGTFYIAHNGNGTVTIGCYENGELTKIVKANAIKKDWNFSTLLGYYTLGTPMLYSGTMKYMKIRHDNLLLSDINVPVAAPAAYAVPQTSVSGDGYTGTITWNPSGARFTEGKEYSAHVVLTADEGNIFGRGFDVTATAGELSNLNIEDDAVSFDLAFGECPAAQNYYWNFKDTSSASGNRMSAVVGDGWSENTMSYKSTSDANKNVSLNANSGITNSAAYFVPDNNIYLPKKGAWTIEWQGSVTTSSMMMTYNTTGTPQNGNQIYIVPNYPTSGSHGIYFYPVSSSVALKVPDAAARDADTRWFFMNDGTGKITVSAIDKNGIVYSAVAGTQQRDLVEFNKIFGCYNMATSNDRRTYAGTMRYLKIYHSFNNDALPVAEMNGVKYLYLNDAIDAAAKNDYNDGAPAEASVINLLRDTDGGFDVGVETNSLDTFKTQNIVLNLNGHTVNLGNPPVGSSGSVTKGIRVLANSKLVVNNGTLDVTSGELSKGMNIYGECELNSVNFIVPDSGLEYTVRTRGDLTLSGTTSIPSSGDAPAIVVEPYEYSYDTDINAILTCDSEEVTAGDIVVKLNEMIHHSTHAVNEGVPELNISAGTFGTITETGDAKTPEGNITGGTFDAAVPENLCGDGYIPSEQDPQTGKYTVEQGAYAAELIENGVTTKYRTVNEAVAAAAKNNYYNGAPDEASVIKLLMDAQGGFDVGVETNGLDTFKTQNIVLNLNGHTVNLGNPPVGSSGSVTKGIRVLANSKLVVNNGTLDVTSGELSKGMNIYGECELNNVSFTVPDSGLEYTVRTRGDLTLSGTTSIPSSGGAPAIVVEPYEYSYTTDINAILTCDSEDVKAGDIVVKLNEMIHHTTFAVNAGVPELNISAGEFGAITETGDAKTPEGNITGGTFDAAVPENLCGDGYIPSKQDPETGKYTVEQGEYVAEMTVNGVTTKYTSINEAIADAPVKSYAEGKAGESAEKASIKLLKDTVGGFDVGVETNSLSTFKIQNIELDLDGHTLTLGQPLVGSSGTVTNGIRVLAYSKFVLKNGTVSGLDSGALRGLQTYGDSTLEDVTFTDMSGTYDSIGNFGSLTLLGETTIPNGRNNAILNSTYLYSDDSQVPVSLTVEDEDVTVGKVKIDLEQYTHPQTHTTDAADPVITISNGVFKEIYTTGSDKDIVGGVTGGTFDVAVPENVCGDGYIPTEQDPETGKYTVKPGHYVAQIGDKKYESVPEALADVPTGIYPNTPENATTILLLDDVSTGFDIGVETGSLSTFKTQNVIFDLDGHTMTLGHPTVGSTGTQTQGIRVLAFSKLEMSNGSLEVDTTAARVTLANYGTAILDSVNVGAGTNVLYTINNAGSLTLSGDTTVANGTKYAIANWPYNYPDAQDINVVLNVDSEDVTVGDMLFELEPVIHPTTHAENTGIPEVNISAGEFGTITETGDAKTPEGNITGGTFDAAVPEDLCGDGYIPSEQDPQTGKYTVEQGAYAAELIENGVTTKYRTVNEAVAAAAKNNYYNGAPDEASVIKLLMDAQGGFDVGVETNGLDTFKTQNIVLDLNNYTLELGYPAVGSAGSVTKGIRVLANSKLVVNNGTLDVTSGELSKGMNIYGECELNNVSFTVPDSGLEYTVRTRGDLTLSGTTSIPSSGGAPAIVVEPYEYSYTTDINAILTCDSEDVKAGDIVVKLNEMIHHTTFAVNAGVPELNISAGEFGAITETGDAKTPEGNITGGTFDAAVPENLCGDGYIPSKQDPETGKYTVEQGEYVAEMTVNGVTTKYTSINEAIADAPVKSYAEGKAGESAEKASIKLLKDTVGGFDVGVETNSLSTFKIQNIELDLDGHTLTLGQPLVGSSGTVTNGIRVLAYSKFVLKNGTVSGLDSGALRGLQTYGDSTLEDVTFTDMSGTYDSIGNFGSLTLLGETTIPNGRNNAILNSTYLYSDDSQVPVSLTVEDEDVTVGKVKIDLEQYTHPQTHTTDAADPVITISNGVFKEIYTTGSDKDIVGGVTGGTFDVAVPENVCGDGYIPTEQDPETGKYTVKPGHYVAQIGDKKYESVPEALADVPTGIYPNTPENATTILLLDDVSTGFDIGVETGSLSTFKTQNVIFDLDGHTMTLGHPTVGSTGTQTQGIRVLAFSKLEMSNGSLEVDTTAARVTLANYGTAILDSVNVGAGTNVLYTINNAGSLTLSGDTTVANGTKYAIANWPYNYPDAQDINVVLNVDSEDVTVGDMLFELEPVIHPTTHAENTGVPEVNISAGTFGTITETGDAKTPEGNITGGTFDAAVPENLCGDGFIPTEADAQGKFTVVELNIKYTYSIALESEILINYYIRNLPAGTNPEDYSITYTFNDNEITEYCSDLSVNSFVIARCAAKQINDEVTVVIKYGDQVIKEGVYSVRGYCDAKIEKTDTPANLKALCEATKVYGAEAQKFFNYNTENPAAEGYEQELNSIVVPDTFKPVRDVQCDSVDKVTFSLSLEYRTELNFYFKPIAGFDAANLTVSVDDAEIAIGQLGDISLCKLDDGRLALNITGIAAKDLNHQFKITVSDGSTASTYQYSALTYAYNTQNRDAIGGTSKALYNYYLKAVDYFPGS